jgi:hypothetical protein
MHFIKAFLRDLVDQSWTLLGMAIAWLVLEGSAKTFTGYLIIGTLIFWVVTFGLRYQKDED